MKSQKRNSQWFVLREEDKYWLQFLVISLFLTLFRANIKNSIYLIIKSA